MEEVQRAAEDYREARARLEQAIRAAAERKGGSYRRIAEAAGWSHEQVRQIVRKQ